MTGLSPPDGARVLDLCCEPFRPEDQSAARKIILGAFGSTSNVVHGQIVREVEDIERSCRDARSLVALIGEEAAGTGALVDEGGGVARVQRMSVARDLCRRGIGAAILRGLVERTRERRYRRVVLETNDDRDYAIAFYRAAGFRATGRTSGEAHFALDLA